MQRLGKAYIQYCSYITIIEDFSEARNVIEYNEREQFDTNFALFLS